MSTGISDPSRRLEEREETLEAILDNIGEGVLATGLDGKPVFANPKARELLGLGDEHPPQRLPERFQDFELMDEIRICAEAHEGRERLVHGHETTFRVKMSHLARFDDHRGGVLVVFHNLSEGRRLEANQQRFLERAAHELKTPLTGIIGAAELLITGADKEPETRERFLKHILSEGRKMHRLSETLLGLARIGAGHREPDLRAVRPIKVMSTAAERIEPLAHSGGVRIELVASDENSIVEADEDQLEQALLGLLSNAVKYSDRGDTVRLKAEGSNILVEDEGAGISEEDLPHVFDMFYQGKGSSGGFGLGLSIIKDLIEGMGGSISVDSREGEGTAFTIKLPVPNG